MTEHSSLETRSKTKTYDDHETERQRCTECDGRIVVDEIDTVTICADCGLVVDDRPIDAGPEWRAFDASERDEKSRVGAPRTSLIHDKGMSTTISWQDKDAYGNWLSSRRREELSRLRTWDERFRTHGSDDRNLKHALGEIIRMSSALGLPEPTSESASVIYRRALDEDLLPGRSIEGMATAALYAAARLDGIARSIDEMTMISRVEAKEIKRTYRYLVRELEIEVPPTNPLEYIGRYASEIGCSDVTEREARGLVGEVIDQGLHSGKHPVGIAASAIYAASRLTGEEMTQAEVSEAANISEVTIRNRYREILEATQPA